MKLRSIAARLGAVASATGLLVLGVAGAASAHVTVTPSSTGAGASSMLTFSVPHGCEGSATTEITISMPKEVIEATPTRNPFYDVSKKDVKLAEPIGAEDGDQITEKVDTITYTARTPLPDGYRDAFDIQIEVPDTVGKTLAFPTIQKCEKGQTAWTEVPAAGQDADSLEHPAPSFVIAADTKATTRATPSGEASSDASGDGSGGDGWGYAGVALGAIAVALAGAALARTRRQA
ncbi:Uncharacterized protein YcnI [Nocardioides terrae]|uniref:Uncharacterized protein YcnI n=1 Tax=Nocardioides terrae TaxID=574651 RepID=A0A1I1DSW2_9ACTN|nr:YcnI family protein [Nocardioides terrae]SFB78055.1 Uncharacterized protein YcnI [Nocardioides terrae]